MSEKIQVGSKRKNRASYQCLECKKVLNADQQETHKKTKHGGRNVKFQIFTGDSKQTKLSFIKKTTTDVVAETKSGTTFGQQKSNFDDNISLVVSLKKLL